MSVDPIDTGACDWIWSGALDKWNYTAEDKANFARLLARRCPLCEAEPGARCTRRDGSEIEDLDAQHVARHAYWNRS